MRIVIFLIPAIIGIVPLYCIGAASAGTEAHPWDVNEDGVVNMLDVALVCQSLGKAVPTSARPDPDVNDDGVADVLDLILVGVHYGEEYKVGEIIGNDGAIMVLITAGEFMMGDHHGDGYSDEIPVHPVYLDAFYIDKYEVTNAQYARFLNEYGKNTDAVGHILLDIGSSYCLIVRDGNTYKPKPGYENHPVIEVSWYGAAAYAQFYGKRLPTEAEWERAARGTYVGEGKYKRYVWGDEWPPSEGAGNFWSQEITGYNDAYERTAPVGSFDPNGYGLHDMAGSVGEWCADEYSGNYYSISERSNPKGPGVLVTFRNDDSTNVNTSRVVRGGSWYDTFWSFLRVAFRRYPHPFVTFSSVGFRCSK